MHKLTFVTGGTSLTTLANTRWTLQTIRTNWARITLFTRWTSGTFVTLSSLFSGKTSISLLTARTGDANTGRTSWTCATR